MIQDADSHYCEMLTSLATGEKLDQSPTEQGMALRDETYRSETSAQDRAMNTICFLVGSTVSLWPIGTLISGPPAIACIYWYATGGAGGKKKDAGGKPPLDTFEAP